MRRDVEFPSQGSICRGWLYVPDDLAGRAPAIVMANAVSATREITLPGYAERFARAGFVVLAFDYRHYGSSDGEPRNHLDPHEQQQDVRNAITWLRAQPEVHADEIGGWGISIGGVHMLYLGAFDRRLKAVCSVATGLNTLESMMGRPMLQIFLRMINGDRDWRFRNGEAASYMPAVSPPGKGGLMAFPEANDFYTDAMNTYAPTYQNRITVESVENLISDQSEKAAPLISPTALLMVHGTKDLIPVASVQAIFDQVGEPKKLLLLDCLHTDLYTREPFVSQSADAAVEWFNRYLHNPRARSTKPQDAEHNKAVIRRFYEATNRGELGIYDELFATDFVSYSSAAGGELRGAAAFKAANQMYLDAFPDFATTVEEVVAEGDRVLVTGTLSGTHTGEFMGLAATNRHVTWTGVAIYRFNDEGRIDGRWQEFDGLGLFSQLGIIPSPDSPPGGTA